MTENIERKQIRALHSMILEYLSKTHENQADISWTDFLASNRNHGKFPLIQDFLVKLEGDQELVGKVAHMMSSMGEISDMRRILMLRSFADYYDQHRQFDIASRLPADSQWTTFKDELKNIPDMNSPSIQLLEHNIESHDQMAAGELNKNWRSWFDTEHEYIKERLEGLQNALLSRLETFQAILSRELRIKDEEIKVLKERVASLERLYVEGVTASQIKVPFVRE